MIRKLEIANYVLIDQLSIEFGPHLNVLTGETGAGKSIILGALSLIKGARADTQTLKNKKAKCIVEAHILLDPKWKDFFESHDLDFSNESTIRREILPSSKSRAFVNDTPVKLSILKELGEGVLSIHQQFDHRLISDPSHQLKLLDGYGQLDHEVLDYQSSFESYQQLKNELSRIKRALEQQRKDQQLNTFLLTELNEFNLNQEDYDLREKVALLENAEHLNLQFKKFSYETTEKEQSLLDILRDHSRALEAIAINEKSITEFKDRLGVIITELEELSLSAQKIEETLDYDEQEVFEKKERLDLLIELQRKHQVNSMDELMQRWQELESNSSSHDELLSQQKRCSEALEKQDQITSEKAKLLSGKRKELLSGFTADWKDLLKNLAMPNIRIEGLLKELESFESRGKDVLDLKIAVNKGSDLQPIADSASGGEISRMALAVYSLISDQLETPTLIFDEIDTGVSGEVSSRMGTLLQKMSLHRQVLCITHSPQIASKGALHWKVYKRDLDHETVSEIVLLDEAGRVNEIAGMLSGMETTEAARQNALVLLQNS